VPGVEHVYGFQRASASSGYKITMLNRGESPLKGEEPGLEELLGKVVGAGKFSCTADFSKIAEIFYRAGFVERYGSGIERMITVLNAAGLPLPAITSTPLGFTLTMRKDPFTEEYLQEFGLNKRQVAAISFLRVHGTITNSQYQELNTVAARTAVNDLTDLARKRIIERRGRSRRDTHYILAPAQGGGAGERGDDARQMRDDAR